jgi:endonuclease VIII
MPEGDVVWYTARRLHRALAGRTLTRSDFRVPRLATADLSGDLVTEAVSRGKHLLVRTRNGFTVHTHLRMDGTWRVRSAAERVRDSHRIRLVLANGQWQAIGYQLGVVELNLAGIGNLYKAEVLFLRGINPWRAVGSVTNLAAMAELARRLLDANKERIGQVTTGNWRRGEETWVYGRRGLPCRRCGTEVQAEGQQDRVTFWCPSCQPG